LRGHFGFWQTSSTAGFFDRKFLQTIITRVDANDEIYKKILDDEDFRATLGEFYLRKVYERREPAAG
jgi:hypothetical protein